ncbi:MAG: hypothetical protein COB04_17135 [Gammaproteobacteria bacterium]|nr:MAG: hypothetical protein COB04_17135 [Gammaproteobacteria bacterium]
MSKTLIIQSHRQPLPQDWLQTCMESVESWAKHSAYEYLFLDDELFGILPDWVLEKTQQKVVIATDLARLKWLQYYLASGYESVIWMDADFLIFSPDTFKIKTSTSPLERYTLGREIWIQPKDINKTQSNQYKSYKKVHNAFLHFQQGNHFLDFYTSHAERLLYKNTGNMPPQFIGPKLLTALHNIVQCPVQENAGMLSPWLIKDRLKNEGAALNLFRKTSPHPLAAANLCASLSDSDILSGSDVKNLINQLLSSGEF